MKIGDDELELSGASSALHRDRRSRRELLRVPHMTLEPTPADSRPMQLAPLS